jgi:hypothetical protein
MAGRSLSSECTPKFNNEHEAENVKEAIGRYEISHPVIVDSGVAIWQSYGASGWPTIAVIRS